jgi:hypothetical protein
MLSVIVLDLIMLRVILQNVILLNAILLNVMAAKSSHPRAYIIKLISVVIYGFCTKLECLSLNTRLGWKHLAATNTLAYYGNRKLRP